MCLCKSKSYVDTRCFTVNTPHSPFALGKTMETFHLDMSKVAHRRVLEVKMLQSHIVVSRRGQLFFVDAVYILWWFAHVFTETYGWGKPRSVSGQMYGGWRVGRSRVGGHETRP